MDVKVYDNTTEMLPEDPSADAICMRSSNDSYCQMAGMGSIIWFMSSPAYDVFFYQSLYDFPGHIHQLNVLFWGLRGFPINIRNRDVIGRLESYLGGGSMVDMGQYKAPLFRILIYNLELDLNNDN